MMADAPGAVRVQGMTISAPVGWRDQSMLVVSAVEPGPSGVTPTLVVTREPAGEPPQGAATPLETFVDRQVDQMRVALASFAEVSRRRAGAADPAAELVIDWVSDGVPLTQWITYAPMAGDVIVIATATVGRGDLARAEPAIRDMLRSFRTG